MDGQKSLAPLPPHYAFVVQFGRDTDLERGSFVGQVEHVASARQARFSSRQEMLDFICDTLQRVASATPDATC